MVAIDISPAAVAVSRRRGVRDARVLALADVDRTLGRFDTVLMLCGNFGLAGDLKECRRILTAFHDLTTADARIVLDSVDPYIENDADDLAYMERNERAGRMPGQVTIRIRYRDCVTPWYDLLNVSPTELEELAEASGWRVRLVVRGEPPDYYAVLGKT